MNRLRRVALLGLGLVVGGLAVSAPASAQVPTTTTIAPLPPGVTPDTPDGRCQWERGGVVENPPRPCADVQPVLHSGPIPVVNPDGQRLEVNAKCELSVPCVANGNSAEVRVVNLPDNPVEIGGVMASRWYEDLRFGLGALVFCAAAALVLRSRSW